MTAAVLLESVVGEKVEEHTLALGVFGVGDSVSDDTLQEGFEYTSGFLVDHGADTLDTTTASN